MPDNKNVVVLDRLGDDEVSLLEILDHVVNAGVVIHGSLVISLAGVDLLYVGLNVVLTGVETALQHMKHDVATAAKPRRALP
jgi:hypothetical protein